MSLALGITGQTTGDAINKKAGLNVFHANNQSAEQQEKDESDCYTWAVQQSGYDPINPTQVQAQQVDQGPDCAVVRGAAGGAAIGAVCGDAGKDKIVRSILHLFPAVQ